MDCSKKVILTGATGLIGKESLKPLLQAGFEVFALTIDSIQNQNTESEVKWIDCNIVDRNTVKDVFSQIKADYLLHFAWITTGDYLTSDMNYKLLDSSLNMLDEFKINGGKRAVFPGTCFEYKFKDSPLKETDELNPLSVYAKCKNELRQRAQEYAVKNSVSFAWGRIFYVYGHGENEKRLVPHIIKSLRNNNEVIISVSDAVRDYMYSKTIAEAFVKLLESNVEGCVNICSAKPVKIRKIAEIIAEKLNKEHLVKYKNDLTIQQPAIICGDNSRLINEVKFRPEINIEQELYSIMDSLS